MKLIDKYLHHFHYHEVHYIIIKGTLEECYKAAYEVDLSKSKTIKILFKLRGLPFSKTKLYQLTELMKFTLLEENPNTEFIYGFWVKKDVEWVHDKSAFIYNDSGCHAKVVWNFTFQDLNKGSTLVTTETRVKCISNASKIIFPIYWFFIKPFSSLIRKKMLNLIRMNITTKKAAL